MAPDADKSPAAEGGEGNEEAAQPPMQVSATEAPEPVSPVDLPTEQVVFLVRHAESRWNAAQANMSPMGMIWENDHGLSQEGRHQAEELRRKLAEAKEHLPRNGEKAKWLTRLFSPDVVFSSPFTRALQTACIGLPGILPNSELVVMREAREHKRLGGFDSTGVACGEEVKKRLQEEMGYLYEEEADKALQELEKINIDTSSVEEEWWGPMMGETIEEMNDNLHELMRHLRGTRGTLEGGGAYSVLVGHSFIIRSIFDAYLLKGACSEERSLRSKLVPCCGVIAARIVWSAGRPQVREAVPLLGTELEPPDYEERQTRVSSCTCGRGKVDVSCVIS